MNSSPHLSHFTGFPCILGCEPPGPGGISTIYPHVFKTSKEGMCGSRCAAVTRSADKDFWACRRAAISPSVPTEG